MYQRSFEAPDAHILVVDDNEMNLMVVKKLLAETQIQIDMAHSGAECLRLTQNHHYDCILMDHLMPEMDGIECLHALRVQPGGLCQDVPVVALTANAGSDNQLLYRKEGFSGYLAKPVSGTKALHPGHNGQRVRPSGIPPERVQPFRMPVLRLYGRRAVPGRGGAESG